MGVALGRGSGDEDALKMLFRFPVLSDESIESIRLFDPKGSDNGNILRLELLARVGSAADFETLVTRIAGRDDPNAIPGFQELSSIVYGRSASEDIPALERLCDSGTAVRYPAMDAIRRIRDPKSIPFLLAKLRGTDKTMAHQATLALSQITGRKDLAVDYGSFMNDPEKYVEAWERWAAESGIRPKQ